MANASLRVIRTAICGAVLAIAALSSVSSAHAHDASAYGGLFRSRNLGGTWLNADVGLFLGAALTVAVDPRDPNHLLMGTDIGLLASSNGGRSWSQEAPGLISGAVFAIAFSRDGERVVCAAPTGVFRLGAGRWSRAAVPTGRRPRANSLSDQHLIASICWETGRSLSAMTTARAFAVLGQSTPVRSRRSPW